MAKSPLVSVVVPVHGKAPYLAHTLRGIAQQTYRNFEVLIVDERAEINVESSAASAGLDATIVRSAGAGPAAARNAGLAVANGEFLGFLDCDDVWLPGFLEKTLAVLSSMGDCSVACSAYIQFDDHGTRILRPLRRSFRKGFALRPVLVESLVAPSAALCRRSSVDEIGGWPAVAHAEDRAFFAALAWIGPFVFLPEPLSLYRLHAGNRTLATVRPKGWLDELRQELRQTFVTYTKDLRGAERVSLTRDFNAHLMLSLGQIQNRSGMNLQSLFSGVSAAAYRPLWPEPYFLILRSLLPHRLTRWMRNRIEPLALDPSTEAFIAEVQDPGSSDSRYSAPK